MASRGQDAGWAGHVPRGPLLQAGQERLCVDRPAAGSAGPRPGSSGAVESRAMSLWAARPCGPAVMVEDGCDGGGDGCDGGGDGCDGGGDGPKVGASAAQATPRAVTVGDPPARRGRSVTD